MDKVNELVKQLQQKDKYLVDYLLAWTGNGPAQPWGAATSLALEVAADLGLIAGESNSRPTWLGSQVALQLLKEKNMDSEKFFLSQDQQHCVTVPENESPKIYLLFDHAFYPEDRSLTEYTLLSEVADFLEKRSDISDYELYEAKQLSIYGLLEGRKNLRQQARARALAKLTAEDCEVLGISKT